MLSHLTNDQTARLFTAAVQVLVGVLQIATPSCFGSMRSYFRGSRAALPPDQRDRLMRVLTMRSNAEGDTDVATRYAGIFTIAIAPLALVPAIPFVLPYATCCLGMAIAMLYAYLHYRRATLRRVAPLVRRTPWAALPPAILVPTAVCLLGVAAFAALPQFRFAGVAILIASAALVAIGWRIALAPAVLFGDDPQLEYLVDEHVRFCRATSLMALACAPAVAFVAIAGATLHDGGGAFFNAVFYTVLAAFIVTMAVSLNPLRKRLQFA
ncbi:MAG TPA: hypothetical protein VJP76_05870 [Candidatus Tumulicola sp.]|nr:hypothetical protein [Candidatus Tumulicola sp.]